MLAAGTLLLLAPAAAGQEWRRLAERGMEAFEAGRFQEAASHLDEASTASEAPVAEVLYNLGCARAAAGEYAMAAASFREADRLAATREVRVRSRFNLGRALFERGRSLVRTDVDQAIEVLHDSSRAYKAAWRLDRRDTEAARQVELVRRHIQLLRDQLEMPESLQSQASKQRQTSPDDAEQQKQLQDQSAESEQTLENAMRQRMSLGDPVENQIARRLINQAGEHQQQAREAMEQNEPSRAHQQQQQASEKLKRAAEMMEKLRERAGGDGEKSEQQEGEGRQQADSGEGEGGPPEDPLVESLLEKERRERRMRDEHRRGLMRGATRIEKDW